MNSDYRPLAKAALRILANRVSAIDLIGKIDISNVICTYAWLYNELFDDRRAISQRIKNVIYPINLIRLAIEHLNHRSGVSRVPHITQVVVYKDSMMAYDQRIFSTNVHLPLNDRDIIIFHIISFKWTENVLEEIINVIDGGPFILDNKIMKCIDDDKPTFFNKILPRAIVRRGTN